LINYVFWNRVKTRANKLFVARNHCWVWNEAAKAWNRIQPTSQPIIRSSQS